MALVGCGGRYAAIYRPTEPPPVTSVAAADMRVTLIELGSDADFMVKVEVESSHAKLDRAVLAPAGAGPCSEGIRARRLAVDGNATAPEQPELAGRHRLEMGFPPGSARDLILAGPLALDFAVSDTTPGPAGGEIAIRCVRVPLVGADGAPPWELDERKFHLGLAARLYAPARTPAGLGFAWSYGVLVGAQFGRFRLQGEAALGTAFCTHRCGANGTGFLTWGGAPSIHAWIFESRGFGIDLGAGYRWTYAGLISGDASRSVTVGGPELAIRFAQTADAGTHLPAGARVGSAGFEVYVADWRIFGDGTGERVFTWGLGLAWDAGF